MESTLTVIIAMMVVAVLITVAFLWAASRRARATPPSRPVRADASRDTAYVRPPASIPPPAHLPHTDRAIPAPATSPPDASPHPLGHAPRRGLPLNLRRHRRSHRPRPERSTSDTLDAGVSLDAAVRTALGVEVRLGALGIDVPPMRQGHEETVKVLISRAGDASAVIAALVAQSQVTGAEPIRTTAVMFVDLAGTSFLIRRLDATSSEQVVSDTATWEFRVTPLAAGTQSLTVSASMRLPVPGHGERTVAVPSLERRFQVEVDRLYASRAFVRRNWQWVGTSGIAVVAVVAGVIWR